MGHKSIIASVCQFFFFLSYYSSTSDMWQDKSFMIKGVLISALGALYTGLFLIFYLFSPCLLGRYFLIFVNRSTPNIMIGTLGRIHLDFRNLLG